MSILWEKSAGWRWLVRRTRDSKPFFFTFAALCGVVPGVVGYGVMQLTSSRNDQLEAHLRSTARPETALKSGKSLFAVNADYQPYELPKMMGQVNRERLAEFLGELQRKEDTNDRYVAALKGETLTRKRYERIQPVNKEGTPESPPVKEQATTESVKAK
ncbi:hypothetical protein OsI_07286 [Oryza sativa Indica Group]|uniref:Uncharacterized protein n=2 Tax=Oryza sativa TaxID=4530 RepID=A3A732_ORYSJ|nr:hypothetical protein OsI_07286 [Oryza sativa Indica Group]EAZ23121.1 hypothetical protein OsJ_06812 [Oryza sativa Japonica Group]